MAPHRLVVQLSEEAYKRLLRVAEVLDRSPLEALRQAVEKGLVVLEREVAKAELSEEEVPYWKRVVALGESGDRRHVPELIAALEHEDSNVRRLAASALGKLRDPRAVRPLLILLEREERPQVRQYAVKALGRIGDPQARPLLERIVSDPKEKPYIRRAAEKALQGLWRCSP